MFEFAYIFGFGGILYTTYIRQIYFRYTSHMPLVNTLRRHHTAHHHSRLMMEKNMNLTFPVADWLFGTSDLDRGLLGHLFNGYSQRHVRANLRGQPPRPDIAAAEPITH